MSTHSAQGGSRLEPQARLDVNFPADVQRVSEIVDKVAALARELHGETDKEPELALALTEALANAVTIRKWSPAAQNRLRRTSRIPRP